MIVVMFGYNGTTFTTIVRQGYHDDDYTYTADEGFMIAFGVLDTSQADYSDILGRPMEEYLEIKVATFDHRSDDDFTYDLDVEFHTCTDEDLTKFYPRTGVAEEKWEKMRPLMICIDPAKLMIRGDLFSVTPAFLLISFKIPEAKCRGGEYDLDCVTTKAFDDTLLFKKFFTF